MITVVYSGLNIGTAELRYNNYKNMMNAGSKLNSGQKVSENGYYLRCHVGRITALRNPSDVRDHTNAHCLQPLFSFRHNVAVRSKTRE